MRAKVQQSPLIPAQAGIQRWVPACAGTSGELGGSVGWVERKRNPSLRGRWWVSLPLNPPYEANEANWMLACAGHVRLKLATNRPDRIVTCIAIHQLPTGAS